MELYIYIQKEILRVQNFQLKTIYIDSYQRLDKRYRVCNFNKLEEGVFVKYHFKHNNILENIKNDLVFIQIKAKVWENISTNFNSQ